MLDSSSLLQTCHALETSKPELTLVPFSTMCGRAQLLQSCLTLFNPMDCSLPGSSVHGVFPDKNNVVGCCALPQGIFLTQELNLCLLCLLHCRQILHSLSHLGSPFLCKAFSQFLTSPAFLSPQMKMILCSLFSVSSPSKSS